MANGDEADEYLVSGARHGLKREFAFILSQAAFATPPGRTRAQRSNNALVANDVFRDLGKKRAKTLGGSKIRTNISDTPTAHCDKPLREEEESATERQICGDLKEDEKTVSPAEEESKSDVVDMSSDEEQNKSILVESKAESFDNESPEVFNDTKESDMDSSPLIEDPSEVEPGPSYEVGHVSEPPASYGTPQKSAIPSATITKEELLESSSNADTVTSKLENKTPKRLGLKKSPKKLKELLQSGLLEGLQVRYLRGPKTRGPTDMGLQGTINGTGITCSCDMCRGIQVVSPNKFELHAGSANKRPAEYIFLLNGKSLRDVLNVCKDNPLEGLEVVVNNFISCLSDKESISCLRGKGSIAKVGVGKTQKLSDSLKILKEPIRTSPAILKDSECVSSTILKESDDNSPTMMLDLKRDSPRILVDSEPCTTPSMEVINGSLMATSMQVVPIPNMSVNKSLQSKSQGKLTRKDLRMHKLVFEEDVLPDGTALAYYARGEKCAEGYKKGFGIFCFCCNAVVSPSQFEAHAGCASRRKPYLHIYASNGVSLHELSVALTKTRKVSQEEKDDMCSICGDGGELLCCDSCPRVFHTVCVSLPAIPENDWYCKYCQNTFQKEKFVERNANAVAAGRVAGIDPLEQITKRCIRILEVVAEADNGGCTLCGGHDFNKTGFGTRTVIICDQCEREYHVGCLKEHNMDDLKALPEGSWFCCTDCNKIHSTLENLLVSGEMKLTESSMSLIRKKLDEKVSNTGAELDIKWRLLSGKMASDETKAVLSQTVSIFHDRFDPIADSKSSSSDHLDLIPHMVYGRNWNGQDLGGMYCAVLSVNSMIVSAGVFRIFGTEVAELPLVATNIDFQGLGYFQSLFSCIEDLLVSLNVKDFVLPSAEEAKSIWTNKFGFAEMDENELKQYRKHYQMMVFQGTTMLHKSIMK
ncbi:uncharacterized protein LOC124920631 [Impatiens glandulifera]|uniref:uncharacterized protein LOC124920631 n=1 Tax=Impatiens glandulifera TaxID=253017 RepID=UPI001FB0B4B3|nr:uncharacterized protein LOC124920631 [Impatiens glandulifera]